MNEDFSFFPSISLVLKSIYLVPYIIAAASWLKNNYSKKGMCACYKYGLSHYAKNLVCYKIGDLYYTAVRLIFLKIYFWI